MHRQGACALYGVGTMATDGARPAVLGVEEDAMERVAVLVVRLAPQATRLALRAGGGAGVPVDVEVVPREARVRPPLPTRVLRQRPHQVDSIARRARYQQGGAGIAGVDIVL